MKKKKSLLVIIVIAIICLVAGSGTIINNIITLQKQKEAKAYNSEQELMGSYADAEIETADDAEGNEIKNLEINAYFLDAEGNKKRGIYQTFTSGIGDNHSGEYVTLYIDLGLSQNNVSIINGRVRLPSYNAFIIPTLSEGGIIKKVNRDDDIELNEIVAGNSAHLGFLMRESVYDDNARALKALYSRENDVIIEGDYVDEVGNIKHFSKTIKWKLDWNADTRIDNVKIINKLAQSGNLIRLKDNRIVALFEVTSLNKEGGAIPAVGEYKMSGFKINGIAPEITVSDVVDIYNYYAVEDVNYDSASDTLTWKSVRQNAGEGAVINWGFNSYVTAVYPKTLYDNYLKNQTNTVEKQLTVECKNMVYVNPNIQYTEKSLLTDTYPEPGTRYTQKENANLTLQFDNYNGELYNYDTSIRDQCKINSELIYYGVNTSAGYKEVCDVTVNVGGGIINGVKIDWTNDNPAEHSFMDDSGNYYSHEDFKYYTGLHFGSETMTTLGSNGWIKVYDDETNALIGTYRAEGDYKYDKKYKKIRIETSKVINPGKIWIYNWVEIDNEALKAKYPNLTQFEKFTKLASSSNAHIKLKGDTKYTDPCSDYARADYTTGTLRLNVSGPLTADTYETSRIKYSALLRASEYSEYESQGNITYYKNPKVLIEFPSTIKSKNTKYVKGSLNVTSGNKKMNATMSNRLTKDGKDYFIISINGETNNEISIEASFDAVPQTSKIKSSTDVSDRLIRTFVNTTYDGTKIIGNVKGAWWNETSGPDTYDWNGNGITTDGDYFYEDTEIIFTEPVGVRTVTSLVLEGSEEEVLSPDIMELDKNQDGGKTVTVNNRLYNYSDGTLKKLKLVGRIPYKGNKFLKSKDEMGSTFDTVMTSEIDIPSELRGKVTVKYSTEEIDIANNSSVSDIENSKYNWTTNFTSDTKSYMIDFGDTDINKGSIYNFSYKIKIPETLNYGLVSYTSDAIVFNVFEEGQEVFAIPVESPKVGLAIESPYTTDIDFIKVDKDNHTIKLTGAKYRVTRADGGQIRLGDEWVDSITVGSDTESSFSINGLYPDLEYKLEEIQTPENYKSQDVIFKIVDGSIVVISGELGTPQHLGTNDNIIKYQVEIPDELDEAEYKVEYYYQNVDGTYAQKSTRTPETRSGKIGTEIEVTEDDKNPKDTNYILSSHNENERKAIVEKDGTTILKVYFDIMKVNYTVEYYFLNDNGTYPKNYVLKVTSGPVMVGTQILRDQVNTDPSKVENKPDGTYLLDDEDKITTERTDSSLVVTTDESKNVFKVYFTKGYTVTYRTDDPGTFETKSQSNIPYGTPTPLLINNKTSRPGYTFTGWLEENTQTPLLQDVTISGTPVTNDITYVAQWKANENTPYQVWFYYQEDGQYPNEPFAKVDRAATTDTTVNLSVPSKVNDLTVKVTDSKATNEDISRPKAGSNYVYDINASNIITHNVDGDGSTILKVYFKQVPVNYNFDTVLKDTGDKTLTENKFTITKSGTNIDETILWNKKAVSEGVEINENNLSINTYTYKVTENEAPDEKYVNILKGKYVSVVVAISDEGKPSISSWTIYTDDGIELDRNDSTYSYVDVNMDKVENVDTIKVKVVNPVRFTFEVEKKDSEGNNLENTGISIKSDIIDEQNAAHSAEIETESKNGLQITDSGVITGETNENGVIKYEETWVNANEYTYEITETETSGNQYVNILDGYKVVVRIRVNSDGTLELIKDGNRNYTIVATEPEKTVTDDLYRYVKITVSSNSLKAIIDNTGHVDVDITNPVRFNMDLIKKDTADNFLPGTKFSVTREGNDVPLFNNADVTNNIEIEENPIDAGIYTYYIRENQTNTTVGNRYVNVLEGKYIKIKVKVNGNGVIDILDDEDEKNNDYYEVYEDGKTQKVTDNNILKYISVKSHDLDGDGVYTIDVQVINPVRYEIDISTLDTLGNFLDGANVTLFKEENDERKELFRGNATDVNKIKQVEKLEVPADAGTYTYYLKENYAKNERYVNVIDGRYIKIQLTVAPNGMLTAQQELYEGDLGQGTKVETGSVFNYYSVIADNSKDISRLNITLINPVKFIMEVDKYDTAENSLAGTTFEIESPIIEAQKHEHNNEKISGIADGGITSNGVITGVTDNAIEMSPDGSIKRAKISYEETWVNANETDNDYYTYIIRETKTSGAQYVNILEGYQIVLKVHVDAEGNLALKETDGRNYEIVKVDPNAEDITDEVYRYVKIDVSNNKILATLNTEVINPVRYNIAVYQTIYGNEKVSLRNIPVEIQSEFSGNTTLVTDENGYNSMEEKAVWADTYKYKIFQLNEFNGVKVEDEFVNMLDGYYIDIDLNVHGDGVIKTMSADGDETTVSYKLYKRQDDGTYKEINFNDTIVDDFVKVKVTTSQDNVCTLNVYIITPEKYDFKLMKTDIDVLASKMKFGDKYKDISENMNDVEFSVVVKDANGEIVLKDTLSGKDAKTEFETINAKEQKTETIDGTEGIILFDNILIERTGTYTFELTEVTPIVEGMIYKDKSESIIVTADIVVENGKYVLKNMQIPQAERYTIANNTKLTGTETQTINVNVSNERIKGQYDLVLNKINKLTKEPLDGAVYKVTVEQEGKENKVLYISDGDVLSKNVIIPYVGDENQDITGTAITAFNDIRIEIPETYTIKIEEIKAPETFTKLDDIIELEVTTGIEGEYDDAHYVLKEIKLKEGNHDLISETHSKAEDEKQNINVQIENEFFDLALRQYVTDVNGTEITSRKPEVTVTKDFNDGKATTAEYKQVKEARKSICRSRSYIHNRSI